MLILLLKEVDAVTQKKSYKKNIIKAFSSGGSKMIFTLLIKAITFYVGLTIIHIRWSIKLFHKICQRGKYGLLELF